jgi:hypothetical protein
MKIGPVTICNKLDVCGCGCHGSDPWHKSWYKRAITLDQGSETTGTVRMPYSTKPVRVVMHKRYSDRPGDGFWVVDRKSIVFDRTEPRYKAPRHPETR